MRSLASEQALLDKQTSMSQEELLRLPVMDFFNHARLLKNGTGSIPTRTWNALGSLVQTAYQKKQLYSLENFLAEFPKTRIHAWPNLGATSQSMKLIILTLRHVGLTLQE